MVLLMEFHFVIAQLVILKVKSIQTDREMMLARNKSMADFNLSLQNRLENLKSEVARGYEDANKLKIDLAQDKSKIGKQCLK